MGLIVSLQQNKLFAVIELGIDGKLLNSWQDLKPDEVIVIVDSYVHKEPFHKRREKP